MKRFMLMIVATVLFSGCASTKTTYLPKDKYMGVKGDMGENERYMKAVVLVEF